MLERVGDGFITNPETFLYDGLETGIVSFAFGTQDIGSPEMQTVAVSRKHIVGWNRFVFGKPLLLLSLFQFSWPQGVNAGLGLTKRAAVFLTGTVIIHYLSVIAHGKPRVTDGVACGEIFDALSVALFGGYEGFAMIKVLIAGFSCDCRILYQKNSQKIRIKSVSHSIAQAILAARATLL